MYPKTIDIFQRPQPLLWKSFSRSDLLNEVLFELINDNRFNADPSFRKICALFFHQMSRWCNMTSASIFGRIWQPFLEGQYCMSFHWLQWEKPIFEILLWFFQAFDVNIDIPEKYYDLTLWKVIDGGKVLIDGGSRESAI